MNTNKAAFVRRTLTFALKNIPQNYRHSLAIHIPQNIIQF